MKRRNFLGNMIALAAAPVVVTSVVTTKPATKPVAILENKRGDLGWFDGTKWRKVHSGIGEGGNT